MMQAGSSAAAAAAASSSMLHTSNSLPGACRLSVRQHRNSGSSGDGADDNTTPTSIASGGSTPGRLKRAFLAAVRGERSSAVTSTDAWDQIVKHSRQQHKKICYILLVAIVVLTAVGAGGIAAGAKAKAAHQRAVDAAAAQRAARRNAAAEQVEDEGSSGTLDALRLGFGVTLNVVTSEPPKQACVTWFGSEERTLQYEQLLTDAYSKSLGIQQSGMSVDNITCGGSSFTTSSSANSSTDDTIASSSSSSRALKQAGAMIEVLTVFSIPQQPDTNSTNITSVVMTRSGSILSSALSLFFAARTIVTQAGPTSNTNSSSLPSTADTAVKGFTAAKPQPPAPTPAEQAVKSGAAAADIIKAGGIAAEAVGAAPVTPSQAAHRDNGAPRSIPLVVVDHDGTVIINAPDEVLMPESAAVNATQVREFQDALKAGGRAKQKSTVQIQLPPGLAVQDLSPMPDDVIPVTQATFVASDPPVANTVVPAAAPEAAAGAQQASTGASTTSSSTGAAPIAGAAPEQPASQVGAVATGSGTVTTPDVATGMPAPPAAPAAPTAGPAAGPDSTVAPSIPTQPAPDAAPDSLPNPSKPVAETTVTPAPTEDLTSHPATTTFFPEVHEFTIPESAVQTPVATLGHNPTGPPTESELAAYNWDSVLLETYELTPMCPFIPARGNFMSDALGRLWSLANGHACVFKAPNPITLAADPSGTKGAPLLTWETAADCGEAPNASNSVKDVSGHVWGWTDGVSCAFKSQAAADQAGGQAGSGSSSGVGSGPRMDTVWEEAPICSEAPMKFTAVPDVFGRLWGVESDGRSCAYKYTGA